MLGQLYAFDKHYLEQLRHGDVPTAEHFADYFGRFLRLAPDYRSDAKSAIEDIRQETFLRVWVALRKDDGIRRPERFGAFVTSVCKNVRREHQRKTFKEDQAEDDAAANLRDRAIGAAEIVAAHELRRQVGRVLAELPAKPREVIRRVLIEECDKDEVCRALGINRQYLRVLLFRAKRQFRKRYLEQVSPKAHRCPTKHLPVSSPQTFQTLLFESSDSGTSAGVWPPSRTVGKTKLPHQVSRAGRCTSCGLTAYAGGFK